MGWAATGMACAAFPFLLASAIFSPRFFVEFQSRFEGDATMSILAWIVLGLVAGFIGSKVVNKSGEGLILDLVLGIVGAVVGGWLFSLFGAHGVTGLNIYSFVVAVVGAIVVLVVYHAIKKAV
jgi:uncharacterized membrane protein YeaQ/YmgE (transglycosylase-associated protein family)